MMKTKLIVVAALMTSPVVSQAQSLQYPGFYVGAIGGLNWQLNNSMSVSATSPFAGISGTGNGGFNTGWAAGGMVGYDFVGPRVELEGMYHDNTGSLSINSLGSRGIDLNQTSVMANVLYDFNAGGTLVPYVGVGAGVAFLNASLGGGSSSSTQFAYQAMIGLGYNIDPMFRINLEGRYYGTTSPNFSSTANVGGTPVTFNANPTNNNFSLLASIQVRFGAPAAAPPAAASAGCGAVVHGLLRLGSFEPVATGAIDDQAGRRPVQGHGQGAHYRNRPYRYVRPGELQHGAVAASCEHRQGCSGARQRTGDGDHGHRQG